MKEAETRREKQQREVDANYEAFKRQLPQLLDRHAGAFALTKNREIVNFFDTRGDAIKIGNMLYDDRIFSVHEVSNEIVDLGIFSA